MYFNYLLALLSKYCQIQALVGFPGAVMMRVVVVVGALTLIGDVRWVLHQPQRRTSLSVQ